MTQLHKKINQLMAEKNLTATDIQKITGLNRNTVYSIVAGNSKNPSAHNLQLIAKALDINLETILMDSSIHNIELLNVQQLNTYQDAAKYTIDQIIVNKVKISMDKLLDLIMEVYQYSVKSTPPCIDKKFIKWLIDKQN